MCRTQGTRVQNGRETHAGKSPREEFSFLGYGSLRAFASATVTAREVALCQRALRQYDVRLALGSDTCAHYMKYVARQHRATAPACAQITT